MAKDYYKTLGLNKTDSEDTIKKTYRGVAKRLNPNVKKEMFLRKMTGEDSQEAKKEEMGEK